MWSRRAWRRAARGEGPRDGRQTLRASLAHPPPRARHPSSPTTKRPPTRADARDPEPGREPDQVDRAHPNRHTDDRAEAVVTTEPPTRPTRPIGTVALL